MSRDARLRRLAARYLDKRAGEAWDSKTLTQLSGWVSPEHYAGLVYCLVHGCSPDDLKGDELEAALLDPVAKDAQQAKEHLETVNLAAPKASELLLRYPIEVIKKYKGNLKNFEKADQDKLSWVAKATVAVVKYQRTLRDARSAPVRSEGWEAMRSEQERAVGVFQNQIKELGGVRHERDADGKGYHAVYDTDEEKKAKRDAYALLIRDDAAFMDEWVELEVMYAVSDNFILNTLDGPTLDAQEAVRLVELDKAVALLKEATEVSKKVPMGNNISHWLDSPEGVDLVRAVREMRDWTLENDASTVIHRMKREVPVTLVWATAKGNK